MQLEIWVGHNFVQQLFDLLSGFYFMHLVPASSANLGQHQFEVNRVRMAGGIKRIVLCKIQSPVPVKLWPARFGFQNQAIIQIGFSGSFCFWTLLAAHFGANPRPLDVLDAIYVVIKNKLKFSKIDLEWEPPLVPLFSGQANACYITSQLFDFKW